MKANSLFDVAEIKLTYTSKVKAIDRPQIRESKNAYDILLNNWSDQIELVEEFYLLLLNRANRVLGIYLLSRGGVAGTVVDAKIVFVAAIRARASSIIMAHNHPSGNLKPSQADIDITLKLKKAGELLDITVHDHLIISSYGYYSFADEGML